MVIFLPISMNRLFTCILALLLPLLTYAQQSPIKHSIEIDASSFKPVNTDPLTGVAIDKIERDNSLRPCARIKLRINRMTRADIEGLQVKVLGGIHDVMKKIVAHEGNGLIVELTAKHQTRFYLHHDKYGDSNEVTLNLEGNKEYRLDAQLNYLHNIVVSSNTIGADVYLDDVFSGRTGDDFTLTIEDVMPGEHKIRVQDGNLKAEKVVEVSGSHISFRVEINKAQARAQYVVFEVKPKNAAITIDQKDYTPDQYGQITCVLQNGSYNYTVSAKNYHSEEGTFVVNGAKVEKSISLRPAFGWLSVPGGDALNGASVYVDGNLIGKAPLKSDILPSGSYEVRIVKDMYVTHIAKVKIEDNQVTQHSPSLVADFAHVTLSVDGGCDIYINNEYKGRSKWSGDLATGTYIFEARKTNHTTTTLSKSITAVPLNQHYTLDTPKPIIGTLNILSSPAMADVYVDDKLVGRTPLSHDLIIGEHIISIRKDGFDAMEQSVTIAEGETKELNLPLVMNRSYAPEVAKVAPAKEVRSTSATHKSTTSRRSVASGYRSRYRDHQKGFESMIDFSTDLRSKYYFDCKPYYDGFVFDLTYTAGYRVNNYIYFGAGIGLSYSNRGGSTYCISGRYPLYDYYLNPLALSVPLFAYLRANLINRRFSPFVALQIGGKFSGKQTLYLDGCDVKYPTSTFFATPQLGLNFRTSTKTSIYVATGVPLYAGVPFLRDYSAFSATIGREFDFGVDVRLGVTF